MKNIKEIGTPAAAGDIPVFEPAREAHHRIANSLALIASFARMQAARAERPSDMIDPLEFGSLLVGLAANIEAVASLHRYLSQTPSNDSVDACAAIKELCAELKSAFSFSGQWTFAGSFHSRCMMPPSRIIPICIVITELVTNAIKYAHPGGVQGLLTIDVRPASDGSLALEVMDDGVGFPEGFNVEAGGNIGLGIVRALVKDLNGSLKFDSDELGTVVRLRIPRTMLAVVAPMKETSHFADESLAVG